MNNANEDKPKIEDALKDLKDAKKALEELIEEAKNKDYKAVEVLAEQKLDEVERKITEAISKLDGKTLQDIKDTIKKLEDIRTKDIPAATKVRDIAGLSPKQLVLNEAKKNYEN